MEYKPDTANGKSKIKEIVLSFIEAMNLMDYQTAKRYVSKDFSFVGVLGSRSGADTYFQDMEKMKFTYDIQKVFVDEQDVCLWYTINMSGLQVLTSGWYHLEKDKITSLKVLFDPRPVLESKSKP